MKINLTEYDDDVLVEFDVAVDLDADGKIGFSALKYCTGSVGLFFYRRAGKGNKQWANGFQTSGPCPPTVGLEF